MCGVNGTWCCRSTRWPYALRPVRAERVPAIRLVVRADSVLSRLPADSSFIPHRLAHLWAELNVCVTRQPATQTRRLVCLPRERKSPGAGQVVRRSACAWCLQNSLDCPPAAVVSNRVSVPSKGNKKPSHPTSPTDCFVSIFRPVSSTTTTTKTKLWTSPRVCGPVCCFFLIIEIFVMLLIWCCDSI